MKFLDYFFSANHTDSQMLLQEERHNKNSVAFRVEIAQSNKAAQAPEIKKRLEAEANQPSLSITIEQINLKLQKAEEKRKLSLRHPSNLRGEAVRERKGSLDQARNETLKLKVEAELLQAEQTRTIVALKKREKLRAHISKVEKRRHE